MDNVERYVVTTLPWKFVGYGWQESRAGNVEKKHTTLKECFAFCSKRREELGATWNGLWWIKSAGKTEKGREGECSCNENDQGHGYNEYTNFLHFRV